MRKLIQLASGTWIDPSRIVSIEVWTDERMPAVLVTTRDKTRVTITVSSSEDPVRLADDIAKRVNELRE
jgi:hypothetical protein